MPRYFFDVIDDGLLYVDSEGTTLDGQEAAQAEGIQALAELARDVLPGTLGKHLTMTIHDGKGHQSFELDLIFRLRAAADG